MPDLITVENDGPLIVRSNYWDSDLARAGRFFVSVYEGTIRVLVPHGLYGLVADMRDAKECVLSQGPWLKKSGHEVVEIMFDDGSDSPFAMHLAPKSFDLLPAEPESREWILNVWIAAGRPHLVLERVCHWRRVP